MTRWRADRRIYLSEDGRIVDETAPGRKILIAPAGRELTEDECRRYCLGPFGADAQPAAGQNPAVESATDPAGEVNVEISPSVPSAGEGTDHRHYWRADGTCRCGALKPAGE